MAATNILLAFCRLKPQAVWRPPLRFAPRGHVARWGALLRLCSGLGFVAAWRPPLRFAAIGRSYKKEGRSAPERRSACLAHLPRQVANDATQDL